VTSLLFDFDVLHYSIHSSLHELKFPGGNGVLPLKTVASPPIYSHSMFITTYLLLSQWRDCTKRLRMYLFDLRDTWSRRALLRSGRTCLPNRMCSGNSQDENPMRGTCTDETWDSPNCPKFCTPCECPAISFENQG
jgi:hypothetical protein